MEKSPCASSRLDPIILPFPDMSMAAFSPRSSIAMEPELLLQRPIGQKDVLWTANRPIDLLLPR